MYSSCNRENKSLLSINNHTAYLLHMVLVAYNQKWKVNLGPKSLLFKVSVFWIRERESFFKKYLVEP